MASKRIEQDVWMSNQNVMTGGVACGVGVMGLEDPDGLLIFMVTHRFSGFSDRLGN
jgi:hypothetical protein